GPQRAGAASTRSTAAQVRRRTPAQYRVNSATEPIIDSLATSDRERPAIGVRGLAVLDGHDGVVELLGERPDLAPVDHHLLALVGQLAHRRDHRGGAGAPQLLPPATRVCCPRLVDLHLALALLEHRLSLLVLVRFSCYSGQDGPGQRRGDDLVA